jgi:hypothetical protein
MMLVVADVSHHYLTDAEPASEAQDRRPLEATRAVTQSAGNQLRIRNAGMRAQFVGEVEGH